MLFAESGKYEPCGLFTPGHIILLIITIIGIIIALKKTVTKSKKEIKQIIKRCTILVWILEAIIVSFKLATGDIRNINNYVPLYYCSLLLYAGALSSFTKGTLKRVGDVFLATGGIAGGLIFMIFPTTSLPIYPMMHIVSLHSFLFHGIMLYLGILINITNYITLQLKDIKYYAQRNMTLYDGLVELYQEFGYFNELQHSVVLEGMEGIKKIASMMQQLKENPIKEVNGEKV